MASIPGTAGLAGTLARTALEDDLEERQIDILGGDDGFETNTRAKGEERSVGEEAWSDMGERLAREWGRRAQELSVAHDKASKNNKCLLHGLGFPAVLVPGVMAIVSPQLPTDADWTAWLNMGLFGTSAALSLAVNFFGFAEKYQRHMDYSARYGDVVSDVKYELVKARRYRVSQDEFLAKVQLKMDNLAANAPDL